MRLKLTWLWALPWIHTIQMLYSQPENPLPAVVWFITSPVFGSNCHGGQSSYQLLSWKLLPKLLKQNLAANHLSLLRETMEASCIAGSWISCSNDPSYQKGPTETDSRPMQPCPGSFGLPTSLGTVNLVCAFWRISCLSAEPPANPFSSIYHNISSCHPIASGHVLA